MEHKNHTIDAKGKKLGRVASEAAHLLMEKDSPAFEKHRKLGSRVIIENAGKLSISEKRGKEVRYTRASGYPGNRVDETINDVRTKHGVGEVVRRAVKGMIPRNRLRPDMLKRLEVKE
ncbi:MAG: uL13 family ribosomal protein [Candidatus Paceibacteria bacterium]